MIQNESRLKLGYELKRHGKKSKQMIWRNASEAVLASRKNRPVVNLNEISKYSKEGSKVLIPGKVLGLGTLNHKVTVAACSFSKSAKEKIIASGGQCLGILEFMQANSSVKDVLVLG